MPRAISSSTSRAPSQDFFQSQMQEPARPQLATLREHHRPNPPLADDTLRRGSDRARTDPSFPQTTRDLRALMQGLNPPLAQRIAGRPERPTSEGQTDTLASGHEPVESSSSTRPVRPVQPSSERQTDQLDSGHSTVRSTARDARLRRSHRQTESEEEQGR